MGNRRDNYEWISADWKGSIKWKGEEKRGTRKTNQRETGKMKGHVNISIES